MIYKTFYGQHIDLSKLVAVSRVYFIDNMGYGGWFVGFNMHFQLLDKPIEFVREIADDEYVFNDQHELKLTDGTFTTIPPGESSNIIACVNLQKQVDEIVEVWKGVNTK